MVAAGHLRPLARPALATAFLRSYPRNMAAQPHPEVKRIGETGQVSVGKALAGKLVRVEPAPEGILLRFVVDVPEKDAWWLQEPHKSELQRALAWAAANPAAETDLGRLGALVTTRSRPGRGKAAKKPKAAPSKSTKPRARGPTSK